MNDSEKSRARFPQWKRYAWVLAVVWTVVVVASLVWNVVQVTHNTLEAARIQARVAHGKDVIYRRWNAGHGGVYVPVTEVTQPNPYLSDMAERDITTLSGKLLTLMNPAYMTRQVHELAEEEYGVRGHITSLNPIRPENAPDPWETEALQAFEGGETEISSIEEMEGEGYMRLMRPLITEKGCLQCHAVQGYQEGDIRGGISVSIPVEPLWTVARMQVLTLAGGHAMLWLMGLGGIVLATQRLTRSERERKRAEEASQRGRDNLVKVFEAMEDGVYIVNQQYDIQYVNPVLVRDFGPYQSRKCYEYFHDREEVCPWCKNQDVFAGETVRWEWYSFKNERTYDLIDTPLTNPDGSISKLEIFRDITERKRAEEAIRQRVAELEALQHTSLQLTSSLDMPAVLDSIAESALSLVGATDCHIYLYDEAHETFTFGAALWEDGRREAAVKMPRRDGFTATVIREGRAIVINDVPHHPLYITPEARKWGLQAIAGFPLKRAGQELGVFTTAFLKSHTFSEDELRVLGLLAGQAAIAIENARLYQETQQRALEQETLREAALALTTALDRDEVIDRILAQLQQVVPYDSASVQLLQEDRLVIIGGHGFPNLPDLLGISFLVDTDNPNREVIRTRASFIVKDAPTVYEAFREDPHRQAVIRSWLGVPLLVGERLVGMVALDKREPGFYTQEHAGLAEAFAAQAAIAIENARLFEQLEERQVYLEGVLGAAPDAIVTMDAQHRIVEWNAGAEKLFGYSPEEVIGKDIDHLVTNPDVFEEAIGFTQRALGGKGLPPTEAVRYRKDGSPVDVILAGSPILMGDELIGVVAVYTDITARVRMEETLRALALLDELTDLYNRRGFSILAEQQLKMAQRGRTRMVLLFADLNGLKQINDTLGHPEGDRALIETADVLRGTFRESDIIARVGGDEFVVLAIETDGAPAEILATRLQQNLGARNAREGRRYKLSLSVGLAHYDPERPCSIDELVAQADRAMYEQKRGNPW